LRYDFGIAGGFPFPPSAEMFPMFDFLIGLAFVLMVVGPPILATIQRTRSRDHEA
jgi:hypothetical protein